MGQQLSMFGEPEPEPGQVTRVRMRARCPCGSWTGHVRQTGDHLVCRCDCGRYAYCMPWADLERSVIA
jgi:hypothetical protein